MNEIQRNGFITEDDAENLRKMIRNLRIAGTESELLLQNLEAKIESMNVVPAVHLRDNVVSMNSIARLRLTGDEECVIFWLGYPGAINYDGKKISILSPMGIALLGSSAGQVVEWNAGSGTKKGLIKGLLYQPEASNDRHL